MGVDIEAGYAACREAVRAAHSSFAVGMRMFPPAGRDGIYAMYAFFRHTDDIVDSDIPTEAKREAIDHWRETVVAALADGRDADGYLAAVIDTARRHDLPEHLFTACIDACAGDVGRVRVADWDELLAYCDGVAGTVGEACLRILGYGDAGMLALSRENSRALQLTNILRDIEEDRELDRVYIPAETLRRWRVSPEALIDQPRNRAVVAALTEVAERTAEHYRRAEPMFEALAPAHRAPIVALTLRYRVVFERLRSGRPAGRRRGGDLLRVMTAAGLSRWFPTWRR